MILLIIGLLVFVGVHSLRLLGVRERLQARLGEKQFRVTYSLVSLAGLILIIIGYGQARHSPVFLWVSPIGFYHVTALLTLPAFILLAAANIPGNRIKVAVGHPMVLGVMLWSLAHLLSNGTLADVLLFGTFLLWSVLMFLYYRREERRAAAAGTAVQSDDKGSMKLAVYSVIAGLVGWVVFAFWLHRLLIGVSPMPTMGS